MSPPSHTELRQRFLAAAAFRFRDRAWDPRARADLASGVLDACALALHVVWTYQAAWADEAFVGSARLAPAVDRLLGHIGYVPGPGVAAEGVQIFVARSGADTVLPPGTEVVGTVRGAPKQVTFATTTGLRLRSDRNEVRAFLPPAEPTAGDGSTSAPSSPSAPPPLGPAAGSLAEALQGHLEALQKDDEAARRAAVARQRARVLADLRDEGSVGDCATSVESLCSQLCQLQDEAEQAARMGSGPGPMSESQEILARQLRRLERRQADAFAALSTVLARGVEETLEVWNARVAAMARFLDGLVAGLVQDARDQVALLNGPDALARLDGALGRPDSTRPTRGRAGPGTDLLYLVGPGGVTGLEEVHPGDWFVIGEDLIETDPTGKQRTRRAWREAFRVLRVRSTPPPGRVAPLTEIQFEPPLRRAYSLDTAVLTGNVVPIVEGALRRASALAGPRVVPLDEGPVAWRRDPQAPDGRAAQIEVRVDGAVWSSRPDLLDAGSDAEVYAVEPIPGGGTRLRFGDGVDGAALRTGAALEIQFRVGQGAVSNVAAKALDALSPSHPEVVETFNPFPTFGGADPEPFGLARQRGPMVVATRDRAVSVEDVRAVALAWDGVLRARAFREGTARRARVVVVVAGEGGQKLGDDDLATLQAHLGARVPPLIAVRVENHIRVGVRAAITLRVRAGADPVSILRVASLRLGLQSTVGEPPGLLDPARIDLDDDLALSALYGALTGIEGLAATLVTALWREDRAPGLADRVVTGPREMLGWATIEEPCALRWEQVEDLG